MKLYVLPSLLIGYLFFAQTLQLKKIIDLPKSAPLVSILTQDEYFFHGGIGAPNDSSYIWDSSKTAPVPYKNFPISHLVQKYHAYAVGYAVLNTSFNYVLFPNFRAFEENPIQDNYKVLDTFVTNPRILSMSNQAIELDPFYHAYVCYEYDINNNDKFVIKRRSLNNPLKQNTRFFKHEDFGTYNYQFLQFDTTSNELCFATDRFLIRVDTNLNVISKMQYPSPINLSMAIIDKHGWLVSLNHDTLCYYDQNLSILKQFKIELGENYASRLLIDSKGKVFLSLYNGVNMVSSLYQVAFSNIVTKQTESLPLETFLTRTSEHSFSRTSSEVSFVTIIDTQGRKQEFHENEFSISSQGLLIINVHLKDGRIIATKTIVH
jgi:hypothetical protein